MVRILLAGGGTAGHTSPLLATAAVLQDAGDDLLCLGTPRGLEVTLIPEAGYELALVPPVPLPRRPNVDLFKLPVRLRRSVKATVDVIDEFRPDVIVGFGGYVSVPAYLAARKRSVPLVVHEGNALAGIANKLGARITTHVATSFPNTDLPHAQYIGLPIRRQIAALDRESEQAKAREYFDLDPQTPTLLVTGGSQGARKINHVMSEAAAVLTGAGVQVLHAAGRPEEVQLDLLEGAAAYRVEKFIDRVDLAYAAADFVLCRAGANTVTEVAAVGLPAAFVPLPIGNGEQALNAHPVVEAGGGLLVENSALTAEWVVNAILPILLDSERREHMSAAAAGIVRRDAAEQLAELIHHVARQGR